MSLILDRLPSSGRFLLNARPEIAIRSRRPPEILPPSIPRRTRKSDRGGRLYRADAKEASNCKRLPGERVAHDFTRFALAHVRRLCSNRHCGRRRKNITFASRYLADQGFSGARQRKDRAGSAEITENRPRLSAITGANPYRVGFDIPPGELLRTADVKMRQNAVPCAHVAAGFFSPTTGIRSITASLGAELGCL